MLENALYRKYDVMAFANGQDALTYMSSNEVNLVITDLNMPTMSGYEVIREAKKRHRFVPCILLTGDEGINVVSLAKEAGASTCLRKPFNERSIVAMVRMVIGE